MIRGAPVAVWSHSASIALQLAVGLHGCQRLIGAIAQGIPLLEDQPDSLRVVGAAFELSQHHPVRQNHRCRVECRRQVHEYGIDLPCLEGFNGVATSV